MDDCVSQLMTVKATAFLLGTNVHSEYLHEIDPEREVSK